ncbi:MAG: glutathione S-transferase C-terminal domain-containing protein, partial [Fimbriimonadaceae bacterium]|nr:glutathione S-transferase C-terminal domain-containing protein [Alphaproteobacteria bacterium]
ILLNVANVFRNTSEAMAHLVVPQVPAWAEACRPKLDEAVSWLDNVMADREFIAGEHYSIADITAVCGLDFMRVTGKKLDNEPNLSRWREAMKARPSYTA